MGRMLDRCGWRGRGFSYLFPLGLCRTSSEVGAVQRAVARRGLGAEEEAWKQAAGRGRRKGGSLGGRRVPIQRVDTIDLHGKK